MILHVLEAVAPLYLDRTMVVVGHQQERVREALRDYKVFFAVQEEQLGTGHAVLCARGGLAESNGTVLILCGDIPLIRPATLRAMLDAHAESGGVLTVMTTRLDDPSHYGRIVRHPDGRLARIVEERDASPKEKEIREINGGVYCARADFLFDALARVTTNNSQNEVYLTDIVAIANRDGHGVMAFHTDDSLAILGVNSRAELALAHAELQKRRNQELMREGVSLVDPATIAVQKGVMIGNDTVIHPGVRITGRTRIGTGCTIEPFTLLHDCEIGDRAIIGPFSMLTNRRVNADERIPPYSAQKE
jgi:bifunctional UDP-N-acetylglucosamine pyrophosphorylase/glucosamine-1-phosphate N-acetyltransferase